MIVNTKDDEKTISKKYLPIKMWVGPKNEKPHCYFWQRGKLN